MNNRSTPEQFYSNQSFHADRYAACELIVYLCRILPVFCTSHLSVACAHL